MITQTTSQLPRVSPDSTGPSRDWVTKPCCPECVNVEMVVVPTDEHVESLTLTCA